MSVLDVAIVGAGPAGLAAATLCAERGLSTSLYDEQAGPGGQIYRGITASPLARPEILGDDYWHGRSIGAATAPSRWPSPPVRRMRATRSPWKRAR